MTTGIDKSSAVLVQIVINDVNEQLATMHPCLFVLSENNTLYCPSAVTSRHRSEIVVSYQSYEQLSDTRFSLVNCQALKAL